MAQVSAEHNTEKIISEKVRKNFSRAAGTYDKNASLQKQVAEKLAGMIITEFQNLKPPKLIYEGGCGTGFLTLKLLYNFPFANFAISDISEEMLNICRRKTAKFAKDDSRKIDFYLHDLNNGTQFSGADLFAVSMALQWVADPQKIIMSVFESLSPGGIFAFSVLGNRTFSWIRECFEKLSVPYPFNNFFSEEELLSFCLPFCKRIIKNEILTLHFRSNIDFFRHMKRTGAINPQATPLSAFQLRQVLKEMNRVQKDERVSAEYEVFYCVCQKAG